MEKVRYARVGSERVTTSCSAARVLAHHQLLADGAVISATKFWQAGDARPTTAIYLLVETAESRFFLGLYAMQGTAEVDTLDRSAYCCISEFMSFPACPITCCSCMTMAMWHLSPTCE